MKENLFQLFMDCKTLFLHLPLLQLLRERHVRRGCWMSHVSKSFKAGQGYLNPIRDLKMFRWIWLLLSIS